MANQTIDDQDPVVFYSAGWSRGGIPAEYNRTTTFTTNAGSNATLTFHGVSVAVFGTVGSSVSNRTPPLSSYTIDGNYHFMFEPELLRDWRYNELFYRSPPLPDDTHTLVVTSLRNNCDLFLLDYFVVSSTTLSTSPMATSLGNSAPSNLVLTAALAGSISAAVTIVLVMTIAYFLKRRCRRRPESNANIISTFWGDAPEASESPMNQIPSSNNSKIYLSNLAHSTPPQYQPPLYDPSIVGETSRSALSPLQGIANPNKVMILLN